MVLTFESLVKVVVLMTGRYGKVLKRSQGRKEGLDWMKVMWRSFAVWEREARQELGKPDGHGEIEDQQEVERQRTNEQDTLFSIGDDEDGEDDDDETLTLAALDALDAIEAFDLPEKNNKKEKGKEETPQKKARTQFARIPVDNMRKIIMLLLLVAPLEPTQAIAVYMDRFTGEGLMGLQATAENVLRGLTRMHTDDGKKGIGWREFRNVMKQSMVCSTPPPFLHTNCKYQKINDQLKKNTKKKNLSG